jgi:arylsulfatase A-like enzyme
LRSALDIGKETTAMREAYGYTLFGQSCLAARRLLEAGSRFVSVFWDAYGTYFSGGWDTHENHYPRLRQYLLPGFDLGFSAFLRDLDERGLLEDTLVVCTTEHGRTPQIDSKPVGAARHHWSRAYSTVLAGGGTHRGAVVGRTDRNGGDVADCPISPKDIQATAFHLLGIPAETLMLDRQKRPHPIAGDGSVRPELLA